MDKKALRAQGILQRNCSSATRNGSGLNVYKYHCKIDLF